MVVKILSRIHCEQLVFSIKEKPSLTGIWTQDHLKKFQQAPALPLCYLTKLLINLQRLEYIIVLNYYFPVSDTSSVIIMVNRKIMASVKYLVIAKFRIFIHINKRILELLEGSLSYLMSTCLTSSGLT